ncbi:MAG: ABC transporter substrate-binding protein [Firmicutes bacterium]|nr:ABC transporter substrate-binding protein [Bacillota bacterium]
MKKKLSLIMVLALSLFAFSGCGDKADNAAGSAGADGKDLTKLKVGATANPHADVLNSLKDALAKEGVDLQVEEYTDYIIPNTAVESGELDANFFQHITYMNDFNEKNSTHLVSVADVHYEPMGIYAGKSSDLKNVAEGAVFAVPSDPTNEARALALLEEQGLIKMKEGVSLEATTNDIAENTKKIEFLELEAAAVARSMKDVDFAVINGNYALEAGLTEKDGLAFEASDSDSAQAYKNVLVVKEGNENNEAIQKLVKALTSEDCRKFLEENYKGMVKPVF